MIRKSVLATLSLCIITLLAVPNGWAREKWPQPTEAAKQQAAAFKRHERDLLQRLAPELKAWAQKGKPDIPSAAKPDDLPQAKVPAFPGAEGGGATSFGGRGGKVYVVTTPNDGGPGSFREACEAAGPRIMVFNVAGIIHLKMPVFIDAPYITIAGQTAPGDGVCIAGQTTRVNNHDVVIRYPTYAGQPIQDLCPDGIPLLWKKKYHLDVNDPHLAQKDLQGDGYTVMDKYLDGLDPTRKIDWSNPQSHVNLLAFVQTVK